jgi:hypothetical protein
MGKWLRFFFAMFSTSDYHHYHKGKWALCDCFLNLTPIYEWYVARLIIMDGHQNDMLCKGIKLCAQSIDVICRFCTQPSTIGRVHVIGWRKSKLSLWPLITSASSLRLWSWKWHFASFTTDNHIMGELPIWSNGWTFMCGVKNAHNRVAYLSMWSNIGGNVVEAWN